MRRPFQTPEVADAYCAIPPSPRKKLLELRGLIFDVAETMPGVGAIEESLKWGEPSYVASNKSGTPIRIHWKSRAPHQCALYVHCSTDLVDRFRSLSARRLTFEKNRAVLFPVAGPLPKKALRQCVQLALAYHLD